MVFSDADKLLFAILGIHPNVAEVHFFAFGNADYVFTVPPQHHQRGDRNDGCSPPAAVGVPEPTEAVGAQDTVKDRDEDRCRNGHDANEVHQEQQHDLGGEQDEKQACIHSQQQAAKRGKALAALEIHQHGEDVTDDGGHARTLGNKGDVLEDKGEDEHHEIGFGNVKKGTENADPFAEQNRGVGGPCVTRALAADVNTLNKSENGGGVDVADKVTDQYGNNDFPGHNTYLLQRKVIDSISIT